MRIITDLFEYCATELPSWNTISISGYHIREAGSTASQEVAFTLANGLAYVEAARNAGLDVDEFAPRLSFFWNAHNGLFEEAAKYRAARRLWARLMRERVGAQHPESMRMRFHTQTAGSSLTAQQPANNVVRTAYQALSAVLGGTQSLHTNSFDEAIGLPTQEAVTVALRTQQILAYESGVAGQIDPLAGSYYVEAETDRIEAEAAELIERIDDLGGAADAIEAGFQQRLIEEAAYETAKAIETGTTVVVGVNRFTVAEPDPAAVLTVEPALEREQCRALAERRDERDSSAVAAALETVEQAAAGDANLLYPMKDALRLGATVGEVAGRLVEVFGRYRPSI
jgi:methylmalonyl-CoA mutase N-terminal domain/subunit